MWRLVILSPSIRLGKIPGQLTYFPGRGLWHRVQPTSDLKKSLGFLLLPPRAKQEGEKVQGLWGQGGSFSSISRAAVLPCPAHICQPLLTGRSTHSISALCCTQLLWVEHINSTPSVFSPVVSCEWHYKPPFMSFSPQLWELHRLRPAYCICTKWCDMNLTSVGPSPTFVHTQLHPPPTSPPDSSHCCK